MKVLIACEESQTVCKAFRAKGHEAYSCDIVEPSGGHPEWHIKGDVIKLIRPDILICSFDRNTPNEMWGTFRTMDGKIHELPARWDLIIAHPPCTYLSNAGARWLYAGGRLNIDRYKKGLAGKEFFMAFLNADCERIVVENPIPSKIYNIPPYTQVIQPYEYGEQWSKKTCLWLKGLKPLQPTNYVADHKPYCSSGSYSGTHDPKFKGASRKGGSAKSRSKTFSGIAQAMADQWG